MSAGCIYIGNARLIDGSGDPPPAAPHALLIEGERIVAVAPQAQLPPPAGAHQIDARGMTLMPGMIDCHDHLANLGGGMVARAAIPPSLAVFMAAESFRQTLHAGITAVRDASGVDLGMKMAVERGLIRGPAAQDQRQHHLPVWRAQRPHGARRRRLDLPQAADHSRRRL